jgi:hypothetical protein
LTIKTVSTHWQTLFDRLLRGQRRQHRRARAGFVPGDGFHRDPAAQQRIVLQLLQHAQGQRALVPFRSISKASLLSMTS